MKLLALLATTVGLVCIAIAIAIFFGPDNMHNKGTAIGAYLFISAVTFLIAIIAIKIHEKGGWNARIP